MPQKKKNNQKANQKVLEAQHRNDYLKRLGLFSIAVTGENVLALLPEPEREFLYKYRVRYIMPMPEEGFEISGDQINFLKGCLNVWFRQNYIHLRNITHRVMFSDYYEFSIPLHVLYRRCRKMGYRNAEKVMFLLSEDFSNIEIIQKNLATELATVAIPNLLIVCNDFSQNFYSFRLGMTYDEIELRAIFQIFIRTLPVESVKLMIDEDLRQVYRVGWTYGESKIEWQDLELSQLGLKATNDNKNIPVYIQKHAMQRLRERLDSINPSYLNYHVCIALKQPTYVKFGDTFLIEYNLFKEKVGYLVAVISGGKLIIRTFLFLTCADTPEGRSIEKLLGLKKLDTAFLKMERLSTFMPAHLKENEELRIIFEKVGCPHLLNLHEKLDMYSTVHPKHTLLEMVPLYIKNKQDAPSVRIKKTA